MRILFAEDDEFLAGGVAMALRDTGYSVDHVKDGAEADVATNFTNYDLIILDLGLPKMDGLEVLQRLRQRGNRSPVLIVTARDSFDDRVRGLDLGANDYLVKPFYLPELEARIRALLRNEKWSNQTEIVCGNVSFNTVDRSVTILGEPLALSSRELSVLEILFQRKGRIVSKGQLSEHMSDFDGDISYNAIDIIIHRLRKKLEVANIVIETHRGVGYSLKSNG